MRQSARSLLAALCVLLCLLSGCGGRTADLPQPGQGFVYDGAGVLSEETVDHITAENTALAASGAAVVAVVTLPSLEGGDLAAYARDLSQAWSVGDKDGGLLLVLDIGGKDYYALQGEGAARQLTVSTLQQLAWGYLEPGFAAGEYDTAVRRAFDAYVSWYDANGSAASGGHGHWLWLLAAIPVGFLLFLGVQALRRRAHRARRARRRAAAQGGQGRSRTSGGARLSPDRRPGTPSQKRRSDR